MKKIRLDEGVVRRIEDALDERKSERRRVPPPREPASERRNNGDKGRRQVDMPALNPGTPAADPHILP